MTSSPQKMARMGWGRSRLAAQRGFSIVTAIFLLVVLAGLGVVIVNVATVQHTSSQLDIQGTRAYQAARAGMEWGLYRALRAPAGFCPVGPTVTNSFALPSGSTLSQFTVTVSCIQTTNPVAGTAINVYQITATACNQPNAGTCPGINRTTDYVERQVQVTF